MSNTPGLTSLETTEDETKEQGFLANAPKSKGLSPAGQIAMDPKQTAELLANMQDMVDQRSGAFNTFLGGLKDASAWGAGGAEGPARALAVRDEVKAKEYKDVFDMRQQMAAYRAAQAQQEAFNERQNKLFGTGVGGGAAGTGTGTGTGIGSGRGVMINGVLVDDETAAAMSRARNQEESNKIFNDWASKRAQARGSMLYNPGSYEDKIFKNIDGKLVPINAIQAKQMMDNGQGDLIVRKNPQPSEERTFSGDAVSALKQGIFSQESSSGKADTSKPNYAGAIGPMQIKQGTFDDLKKDGLIPQDYDISNPEHNKIAGNALIDKYAKQYKNDPDKIAAAYYGGPGAINKDGSINLEWRDKLNPNAPTVGEYIQQVKQKSGLTSAPARTTSLADRQKTVPELQQDIAVSGKGREAEATKTGEDMALRRAANIEAYESAGTREQYSDRLNNLISTNRKAFGVFANANFASGFGSLLQKGISAGTSGAIGLPGLDDLVRQGMIGAKETDIIAAQKAVNIFAKLALDEAKIVLKGQGAVSNMERELVQQSVASIGTHPEAIKDFLSYSKMRAQYDRQIGNEYRQFRKTNPNASYDEFMLSDQYENTKSAYRTKVENFIQTSNLKDVLDSGQAPAAPTPKWNHSDADYEKWKKDRGIKK
jgi:hypothetical protein